MNANQFEENRAAIVCAHVARHGLAILSAARTEPLRDEDSGWQFLCNSGQDEDEDPAQVWAVSEVLSLEPSLRNFIDAPIGTALRRRDRTSSWENAEI